MQPPSHFYVARSNFPAIQFFKKSLSYTWSVRIDLDKYKRVLKRFINTILVVLYGTIAILGIMMDNEIGLLFTIMGVGAIVIVLLFKPYEILETSRIRQNQLCRGDLRDVFVTGNDFSYLVVGGELTDTRLPDRKAVSRFLSLERIKSLDKKIRKLKPTGWNCRELTRLKLTMIDEAKIHFGGLDFLSELQEQVQRECLELITELKNWHLDDMQKHAELKDSMDADAWQAIRRAQGDRGKEIGKLSSPASR